MKLGENCTHFVVRGVRVQDSRKRRVEVRQERRFKESGLNLDDDFILFSAQL
jgi:hypothetical protein